MATTHDTDWERALARLARQMEYPAAPDVATAVATAVTRPPTADGRRGEGEKGRRGDGERRSGGGRWSAVGRLAWVVLAIALIAATLLAVPQTRAAVLRLFARIGAIEIFIDEAAPTLPSPSNALPTESGVMVAPTTAAPIPTTTPRPTAETVGHSLLLFALGQPTTPEEAAQGLDFTPTLPDALGEPDEAYDHRRAGGLPAITLVWREYDPPLTLTEIGIEEYARKFVTAGNVSDVRVNGRPAVWIEGPHVIQLLGNLDENSLLITSNVLIWSADGLTYRLEGGLSEAEMIAIAESLAPSPTIIPTD